MGCGLEAVVADAQEMGQQSGIIEVDLRRLDQALAQVLGPGGQHHQEVEGLEEREVAFHRHEAEAQIPGQVGQVQGAAGADGQGRQQPGDFLDALDFRKLAQVPLHEGGEVAIEPPRPLIGRGPLERFGKTAPGTRGEDVPPVHGLRGKVPGGALEAGIDEAGPRAKDFPLGQRPEGQDFHSPRQAVRHLGEDHDIGGSRQDEAPGPSVPVHGSLDGEEQLGHPLGLIQEGGPGKVLDETHRIPPGPRKARQVVEGGVPALRAGGLEALDQRALPGLSGTGEEDHRRIGHRGAQLGLEEPVEHSTNLSRGDNISTTS